jgi:hypothetical protein
MKRIVIYFRKPERSTIPGIASPSVAYVMSGQQCTGAANYGGGIVGEMLLRDGLIEIRKVGADGKPSRNFGMTKIGGKDMHVEGDYAVVPAALCFGVVVKEVDEGDESDLNQPAKPLPKK